jgi:AraC-like DNA-binding protein
MVMEELLQVGRVVGDFLLPFSEALLVPFPDTCIRRGGRSPNCARRRSACDEGECLALFLKICRTDMRRKLKHLLLPIPHDHVAQKVADYIAANYAGEIGLQDIAAHAGYSKRHIGRRFADDVKITIFEYLRLYRAFRASQALAHERKKITAVAFDCGYESVSSFYRDFEKYFGLTPRGGLVKAAE